MQTLGLSDSTPRSEGRLKSLLWPSVDSAFDVDYLGTQGFWICLILAVFSLGALVLAGHWVLGPVIFLSYFLTGVGIREHSRYAAVFAFLVYLLYTFLTGISIFRIIFLLILLANVRATFLAHRWKPDSEVAALPPRLGETFSDKLSDQLPAWLWPKVRIPYYIFSIIVFHLFLFGWIVVVFGLAELP
jgi:hypothetical protein